MDLNTTSGVAAGTAIQIQNIGTTQLRLFTGSSAPTGSGDGFVLANPLETKQTQSGDPTAWAYSPKSVGYINVVEV